MTMAPGFPVCLRLEGVPVLLVGGGKVAQARCESLLLSRARVHVVAPTITPKMEEWRREEQISVEARAARPEDTLGRVMVFTAIDDRVESERIVRAARAQGLMCNAADIPELCDFTLPSVGRRGVITVAVSTNGQAPAISAWLRRALMNHVTRRHAQWARLVGVVRRSIPAGPARMKLVTQFVNGSHAEQFLDGNRRPAFERVRHLIALEEDGGTDAG